MAPADSFRAGAVEGGVPVRSSSGGRAYTSTNPFPTATVHRILISGEASSVIVAGRSGSHRHKIGDVIRRFRATSFLTGWYCGSKDRTVEAGEKASFHDSPADHKRRKLSGRAFVVRLRGSRSHRNIGRARAFRGVRSQRLECKRTQRRSRADAIAFMNKAIALRVSGLR